jgi:hypothetical protein
MRLAPALVALAAGVTLTAGCAAAANPGAPGLPEPTLSWTEPAAYRFVLTASCGERMLIGRFAVSVRDGAVTKVTGLDPAGRLLVDEMDRGDAVPTLGALVAQAEQARRQGADDVRVTIDPMSGHPARIVIDHERASIDDEECYDISDLEVG